MDPTLPVATAASSTGDATHTASVVDALQAAPDQQQQQQQQQNLAGNHLPSSTSLKRPLPYDPSSLRWNALHTSNEEHMYCYCGSNRILLPGKFQLQCIACRNWFHDQCISPALRSQALPFLSNYIFTCENCDPEGNEKFQLTSSNWNEALICAMANCVLQRQSLGEPLESIAVDRKEGLVPFLSKHWSIVCAGRQKISSLSSTVGSLLTNALNLFTCTDQTRSASSKFKFKDLSLIDIAPSYDKMLKADAPSGGSVAAKRKAETAQASNQKRPRKAPVALTSASLLQIEHPFNKNNFRYTYAEPDPLVPERFRIAQPDDDSVLLSLHDRAPQLKLSNTRLTVTGEKGYCQIRASIGVSRGCWYFEVHVDTPRGPNAHTRLGWSQKYANLQTPVGYDSYGYSYRDVEGTKFHESRGSPYGMSYEAGDVIGILIDLPELHEPTCDDIAKLPGHLVDYKGYTYYEENVTPPKTKPEPHPGGKIEFFKNGVSQGVAWTNVAKGTYFPAISLYMGAQVTVNFGPTFSHFPTVGGSSMSVYSSPPRPYREAAVENLSRLVLNEILNRLDLNSTPESMMAAALAASTATATATATGAASVAPAAVLGSILSSAASTMSKVNSTDAMRL